MKALLLERVYNSRLPPGGVAESHDIYNGCFMKMMIGKDMFFMPIHRKVLNQPGNY